MKFLIIGAGVTGTATADGFSRFGYDVAAYDIEEQKLKQLQQEGIKTTDKLIDSDIYWICTPEAVVEDVVNRLKDRKGLIVIRSTTLPGTTVSLMEKYKLRICHNPEFLRERQALRDFFYPDRIVIGESDKEAGDTLEGVYKPFRTTIIRTDPTTSEMIKYTSNCWLAAAISYWNEVYQICKRIGVNSHFVAKVASLDERISTYGTLHSKPFGGACLPKDLDALIEFSDRLGYEAPLLKAVRQVNMELE